MDVQESIIQDCFLARLCQLRRWKILSPRLWHIEEVLKGWRRLWTWAFWIFIPNVVWLDWSWLERNSMFWRRDFLEFWKVFSIFQQVEVSKRSISCSKWRWRLRWWSLGFSATTRRGKLVQHRSILVQFIPINCSRHLVTCPILILLNPNMEKSSALPRLGKMSPTKKKQTDETGLQLTSKNRTVWKILASNWFKKGWKKGKWILILLDLYTCVLVSVIRSKTKLSKRSSPETARHQICNLRSVLDFLKSHLGWGTRSLDITDKLKPSIKSHLSASKSQAKITFLPGNPCWLTLDTLGWLMQLHLLTHQIHKFHQIPPGIAVPNPEQPLFDCWSCSRRVTLPPLRSSRRRRLELESEGTPPN